MEAMHIDAILCWGCGTRRRPTLRKLHETAVIVFPCHSIRAFQTICTIPRVFWWRNIWKSSTTSLQTCATDQISITLSTSLVSCTGLMLGGNSRLVILNVFLMITSRFASVCLWRCLFLRSMCVACVCVFVVCVRGARGGGGGGG